MTRKAVSEIMLTLLLIDMLLLTFNVQPVEAESTKLYVDPPIVYALPGESFTISRTYLRVSASPETTIAVDPSLSVANPGEYLSVNITVTDVADLFSWGIKLRWERPLLECTSVEEGPFLAGQPEGTVFVAKIYEDYINVGCTTLGVNLGVSGSGTLMNVTFHVKDAGQSTLDIYESTLIDSFLVAIPHTAEDGYFYNTVPRAQFTYTPTYPVTGENVTFDASSSYDPDGTIVSYEWNFGDETTGTGMVTTHSYAIEGSYTVTLQVTDNDGLSDSAIAMIYPRAPLLAYISVPYHRQINSYYCGPAALEMLFDFYGPDIPQREIADVTRTAPDGTYTSDMIRAAHFSNLSTSVGIEQPGNITGYAARKLGYAAFEYSGMTIDGLKSLIAAGYPIIVLTTWHYRVAVGYSSTRITFQDSYYGKMFNMTYEVFDRDWDYSNHWGLFVSPWNIEVSIPENVSLGSDFNVTATITYPAPPPFPTDQYPASAANATIALPEGLSLVPGETAKKAVGTDDLAAGASANVTWAVRADSLGTYTISVEAEGKVAGFVPPLPSYPESYNYEDRIGGFNQSVVDVISRPPSPVENIQELIETIETWSLPRGTKNSLTSKLKGALHLLDTCHENGAVHKLMIFMKKVEALRGKKLIDEQADYAISEAQRIIVLIEG